MLQAEAITSAQNQRIKRIQLLNTKASRRREEGMFVAEGSRLLLDTPPQFLEEIYVTEEYLQKEKAALTQKLLEAQKEGKQPGLFLLTDELMKKISDTQTPQGAAAVVRKPVWSREQLLGKAGNGQTRLQRETLLLILEDIQDPGNLGTMIRTAEAAGVTGVLMSRGCVDLFHPKTVRSTMSAVFRVPFGICEDLNAEIKGLTEGGIPVYAAALDASARSYTQADYRYGCGLLIGNEGNGLSRKALDAASARIYIPMQGRIESLNAAMAAGILMFEAARQRTV